MTPVPVARAFKVMTTFLPITLFTEGGGW